MNRPTLEQTSRARLPAIVAALRAALPDGGLLVSSSLAHDPFDRLARNVAQLRHIRFLPELNARVTDLGLPALRRDATLDTGVLLGQCDLDREVHPSPLWRGFAGETLLRAGKLRRLDTLFGTRASPRAKIDALIICESAARAVEVLRGGEDVLRTHRPALLFRAGSGAAASHLSMLTCQQHYRALANDSCPHPGPDEGSEGWILALPDDDTFRRCEEAFHARPSLSPAEHSPAGARPTACSEVTIRLHDELPRWGFYPASDLTDNDWSWVGPRPRCGVVLPALAGRLISLTVGIATTVSPRNITELLASINGQPAISRHDRTRSGQACVEICPATVVPWQPLHHLELSMPVSLCREQGPRSVAMALTTITLRTS